MTLNEAVKIIQVWGKYLEYSSAKLMLIFASNIPESFLPFPRKTLEEALNIAAEHYRKMGNDKVVKAMQNSIGFLEAYRDDEEAILQAAKLFNDPKWREAMLPAFKKFHKDWIEAQGILNSDI